jgi:phosphonatase-like hydrolase
MHDNIKLVIFDLAGTTIEDAGQVPEAFSSVLRAHGIEATDEAIRAVRGASKRQAIRRFVEHQFPGEETQVAAQTEQIFAEFRTHLADRYRQDGVRPLPGASDTFAWLHNHGIKIALNTGFDRATAELILRQVGWEKDTVEAVICGDDVSQGRPAPYLIFHAMEAAGETSIHQVANVGDTVLDLQAGWNASVHWNIGVLSGAHTREQLERAPHTHLLAGVAALPSLWELSTTSSDSLTSRPRCG